VRGGRGFPFRPDDIIISTPLKCGTTWTQKLCALLVFGELKLGRPLPEISPWLDMQTSNRADVVATLEAQEHRRFIKTHTPLDGIPSVEGVTYVCVARDPRDVAVSYRYHVANLDYGAFMAARERAVGLGDLEELGPPPVLPPEDPVEWFWLWADAGAGSLLGGGLAEVLHHVQTFWERRQRPRVMLFHYSDLLADLPGQIRRLADGLSIAVTGERIEQFAAAAGFDRMKEQADELVPDAGNNIWRSNQDFFRCGHDGQWRELLDDQGLQRYGRRVAELVPPDVAAWVHTGWSRFDAAHTHVTRP
jgi:aryl sulfotransferase